MRFPADSTALDTFLPSLSFQLPFLLMAMRETLLFCSDQTNLCLLLDRNCSAC